MTSMYEAQKALVAEVKERILALTPEYEESIGFSVRGPKDRALAEMEEDTGRSRLFEIGPADITEPTYIGHTTRAFRCAHDIKINYPADEHWDMGINSDADLIRYDLINNATNVSGVQQRHLSRDEFINTEKIEDDPWRIATLRLIVYYEIS